MPSKIQVAAYHVINPRGKPTKEPPAVGPRGASLETAGPPSTGPRAGLYRMLMYETSTSGSPAAVLSTLLFVVLNRLRTPCFKVGRHSRFPVAHLFGAGVTPRGLCYRAHQRNHPRRPRGRNRGNIDANKLPSTKELSVELAQLDSRVLCHPNERLR